MQWPQSKPAPLCLKTLMNNTPTRERCAACQQISPVGFAVSNEIWEAVVHPQFVNSILCLLCFISRADEKLVPWDKAIKLYPVSLYTHLSQTCSIDLTALVPDPAGE